MRNFLVAQSCTKAWASVSDIVMVQQILFIVSKKSKGECHFPRIERCTKRSFCLSQVTQINQLNNAPRFCKTTHSTLSRPKPCKINGAGLHILSACIKTTVGNKTVVGVICNSLLIALSATVSDRSIPISIESLLLNQPAAQV